MNAPIRLDVLAREPGETATAGFPPAPAPDAELKLFTPDVRVWYVPARRQTGPARAIYQARVAGAWTVTTPAAIDPAAWTRVVLLLRLRVLSGHDLASHTNLTRAQHAAALTALVYGATTATPPARGRAADTRTNDA